MKTLLISLSILATTLFADLETRSLLDNKIEILIPKDFKELSKELVDLKYPGKNRPRLILSDDAGTTNIAFSLLDNPADSTTIQAYKQAFVTSYKTKFPSATWMGEGIARIHGKKVGFIKVMTEAVDQKIFNYLFCTDVDGKLLLGTFNCVEKDMKTWKPLSEQIVSSLQVR